MCFSMRGQGYGHSSERRKRDVTPYVPWLATCWALGMTFQQRLWRWRCEQYSAFLQHVRLSPRMLGRGAEHMKSRYRSSDGK